LIETGDCAREDHGLCAEEIDIDLQQIKTWAGHQFDVLSWFIAGSVVHERKTRGCRA